MVEKAILGKKIGMTQIFSENGESLPVTVIQAGPCVVVQKKTEEKDGYSAVKVGFEDIKEGKLNKPELGLFKKQQLEPKRFLKELKLKNAEDYNVGDEIKVDIFSSGDKVDIVGISKGKGFAGGVKRWGFSRGPMAHGSKFHRRSGSIGSAGATKVFKGMKMPGRMGTDRVTVQNLEVIKVDSDKNLIMIRGSVPGPGKSLLLIKDTVK